MEACSTTDDRDAGRIDRRDAFAAERVAVVHRTRPLMLLRLMAGVAVLMTTLFAVGPSTATAADNLISYLSGSDSSSCNTPRICATDSSSGCGSNCRHFDAPGGSGDRSFRDDMSDINWWAWGSATTYRNRLSGSQRLVCAYAGFARSGAIAPPADYWSTTWVSLGFTGIGSLYALPTTYTCWGWAQ